MLASEDLEVAISYKCFRFFQNNFKKWKKNQLEAITTSIFHTILLKVSKLQKQILMFSFKPKKKTQLFFKL